MPIPEILRGEIRRPFAGTIDPTVAIELEMAEEGVRSGSIPFKLQAQEKTNWCWSAVAVSVAIKYGAAGQQQCLLAGEILHRTNCCQDKESCNKVADLADALKGNLGQGPIFPIGFGDLADEIDADRPVCFRILFDGTRGHFVVVSAYADIGNGQVTAQDPAGGGTTTTLPYEEFLVRYQTTGRCTHSYLTEDA